MSDQCRDVLTELERIKRVSDMLCTGHAGLRDRFARRALSLELTILGFSTWLVALAFVAPRIDVSLTLFGLDPQIWGGVLATFTFFLSVVQLKVDWRGRVEAHKRSLAVYAAVHREAGHLLMSECDLRKEACQRLLARYDFGTEIGIEIPEKDFLPQKRRHLTKIAISKHLDSHPAASILLMKAKFWVRDNLIRRKP